MASSTILTARSLSSGGYRCPDPCPDVECFVGGIGFHPPKEWSLHQTQGSSWRRFRTRFGSSSTSVLKMVGEAGFEPATPWPPAKCAAGLRYSPNQGSILRFLATAGLRHWSPCMTIHLRSRRPSGDPHPWLSRRRGESRGCDCYSAGARASSTQTSAAALRWPANASTSSTTPGSAPRPKYTSPSYETTATPSAMEG